MKIFPSAYLPSVGYFAELIGSADSLIDVAEHYLKRSVRNRTQIVTAQGAMSLTVPVRNANRMRQPMCEVEIDYSKRWQHQHWVTILSAYRSSPYFDHYAPYLEPLYRVEWPTLVEFNEALMVVIIKMLTMGQRVGGESLALNYSYSKEYVETSVDVIDLRTKTALSNEALASRGTVLPQYMQVFGDRLPFVDNASILDLIFCEGTNALALLAAARL
ncbi:MAG: WbqC family protein [Rikenellaceae bacterium]